MYSRHIQIMLALSSLHITFTSTRDCIKHIITLAVGHGGRQTVTSGWAHSWSHRGFVRKEIARLALYHHDISFFYDDVSILDVDPGAGDN